MIVFLLSQFFMFFTYVLKSLKDGRLHIGFTENLEKRFTDHNNGLTEATKNRRPFIMIYYEACLNKNKALERELYFKSGFGRRFLKNRI
ncbi:MAG: GIY-YIG nuclease family protein [Candidatus Komeilibacteria bacterium]|nr:GIY-YIG nuclease family protein [Candidatus Komeilibacteria bacterium]